MGREIKFRAKQKDNTVHNGKWVYGRYFIAPLTDENSGLPPTSGWFFLSGGERMHCIERDGVSFVIDVNTLGQYTGLKDKNGNEIYEGNILRKPWQWVYDSADLNGTCRVVFENGCFGFYWLNVRDVEGFKSFWNYEDDEYIWFPSEFEVIGNAIDGV